MADTFDAVVVAVTKQAESAAVALARRIEKAGQTVTDRHTCSLEDAVRHVSALGASGGVDLICVVGDDPDMAGQIGGVLTSALPVLTGVYAVRRFRDAGGNALGEPFIAGRSHAAVVLALPTDEDAIRLALSLVLPALPALCGGEAVAVDDDAPDDEEELIAEVVDDDNDDDAPREPDHTTERSGMSLGSSELRDEDTRLDGLVPGMDNPPGWKRWVADHKGEVLRDRREELPNRIDDLAPLIQTLHTCGEQAVLKVGRNKMSVWGWPDLQRPSSKVVAIGWGEPFVEVVALHRTVKTGLAISEDRALVAQRGADLAAVSKEVTGRRLKNDEGVLFAVEDGTVWIERDGLVYAWDGKRERNIGTPSQALVSLVLGWSQR